MRRRLCAFMGSKSGGIFKLCLLLFCRTGAIQVCGIPEPDSNDAVRDRRRDVVCQDPASVAVCHRTRLPHCALFGPQRRGTQTRERLDN